MSMITTIVNSVTRWLFLSNFLSFWNPGGYPQAFQGQKAAPTG